ncbi:Beta-galactosidase [Hypsibius exemplaris]|uniref:Beta-galactosidase n=1 Tax=Hypsibius exemplaris TaxID=2072580 RepID=A0A9X6NAA4_HYPEX|nr:Beta-galactosidase [Hypsibius exemplaris]
MHLGVGLLVLITTLLLTDAAAKSDAPSFVVGKGTFLRDGKPFRYISGTSHYWRHHHSDWEDNFNKMRAAGLNAVSTYISWNLHEPEPEQYNFEGNLDIRRYFRLAQKYGLVVILRPGPFIDAEVDMGGLPYWLLRMNMTMKLRSSDPSYTQYVSRWYNKVLPYLKDLTYANGGPIITVQIENEYGSYPACDKVYQNLLKSLVLQNMGPDIVLYTTDGCLDYMMQCGKVDGALTTCDFGAGENAAGNFQTLRKFNVDGPLVNSEFYPGWIDHWGYTWNTVAYQDVVRTMADMWALNASFNIYPIRGGTNFGFVAGANLGNDFQPVTTTYDFDAPLTEAGDPTEKYYAIRNLIGTYWPLPPGPAPVPSAKGAYGKVQLSYAGSLFDNLKALRPEGPIRSAYPLSFEVLEHPYGFVLYRTVVQGRFRDPAKLSIAGIPGFTPGLRDRGIVFVDQKPVGILSRTEQISDMSLFIAPNQTLDILVHNEGRICYGTGINDLKGIVGNVTLDTVVLSDWAMYPLELPNFPDMNPAPLDFDLREKISDIQNRISGFYSGQFSVNQVLDTFLQVSGWQNGYAFINGNNLGRYWPVQGPQQTLFVPAAYLHEGTDNVVELFELEAAPCSLDWTCVVEFVQVPVLNATVPIYPGANEFRKRAKQPWRAKSKQG